MSNGTNLLIWQVPTNELNRFEMLFDRMLFWCFYLQKKTSRKRSQNIIDYIGLHKYFPYLSSEKYFSNEPIWKFSIGGNGQVLSIVQQTTLEMRTEKHYNKTLAKATCNI